MNDKIISSIESIEDFKILIEDHINKTKMSINKNIFDAGVLNYDTKQMISFYEKKREKILNKIKKDSFVFRFEFENENIKINAEDYAQLFIVPEYSYQFLEGLKCNNEFYLKEKKELIEYYKNRLNDIENSIWIAFYNTIIEDLKGGKKENEKNDFYPFDKPESKEFFIYLVENWLKKERNKNTALRYIFTEMWINNTEKETPYKITSTQPYFAEFYWNKEFSNIYKFKTIKNPHLNDLYITNQYYSDMFKKHLSEFKGD